MSGVQSQKQAFVAPYASCYNILCTIYTSRCTEYYRTLHTNNAAEHAMNDDDDDDASPGLCCFQSRKDKKSVMYVISQPHFPPLLQVLMILMILSTGSTVRSWIRADRPLPSLRPRGPSSPQQNQKKKITHTTISHSHPFLRAGSKVQSILYEYINR